MARYDVDEILTKVALVDVAHRLGLAVERKGAQERTICPFHQDSKPSLTLYPANGGSPAHYHCFVCGAHGSSIDLVKQVNGTDFLESVDWIGRQFGLRTLKTGSSKNSSPRIPRESALAYALNAFESEHDREGFQSWCDERKFDSAFLYSKGLRYIRRGTLVTGLRSRTVGEQAGLLEGLLTIGLVRRLRGATVGRQSKLALIDQFQDYFNDGRVIIPITDGDRKRAEVVGFAGRHLQSSPPEGVPKYLLSPGFEKAQFLFNSSAAFSELAKGINSGSSSTLYITEGFLDALRLEMLGQPAVAVMGTSLGKGQFQQLSELIETMPSGTIAPSVSIFLDNDSAGFLGETRMVRELLGFAAVDLRWIGVPWRTQPDIGKDPDTCLCDIESQESAEVWLKAYDLPAEAILLASALGSQDASDLEQSRWSQLSATARDRAVLRASLAIRKFNGRRPLDTVLSRLAESNWPWAAELRAMLSGDERSGREVAKSLYLNGVYERTALARSLAYYGSRRGELPCDEEVWITLGGNAHLFDQTALDRIKGLMGSADQRWHQASPYDAVHLPRKLTANEGALSDPRLKVMPHPADLQLQQILLNEILTQRHDRVTAAGSTFSSCVPAVRWYGSRKEVVVTGPFPMLNEPDADIGEPATLSFGYQIDMDVLEGDKSPSDQGMYRPFGQCWRDFMACLAQQCHAIGPRVHVLRLDAKRYYDSIQRYVVRDALLTPLKDEFVSGGIPQGFANMMGVEEGVDPEHFVSSLERILAEQLFGYVYKNPEGGELGKWSDDAIGIPQGPVISAYIGTIALFPVDNAARQFIRRTAGAEGDGRLRPRAGYARYVDDVVIFADSESLLNELRESLQAEALKLSISLIHKGDMVRSGAPDQVMQQLNEGRGLAASVPAWEPPLVGDGEAGWGIGQEMPPVDRQCALSMLRHPELIADPPRIWDNVKAAMQAMDLRPNDLGLCARWIWWQVAAELHDLQPEVARTESSHAWQRYWTLWDAASEGHDWASAFKARGYHWLYAVEGLDRLLDPNPWIEGSQTLAELPLNVNRRKNLAKLVCRYGFFSDMAPAVNFAHVIRRAQLVAGKARRLSQEPALGYSIVSHAGGRVTPIEWACMAAEDIRTSAAFNDLADWPALAALRNRELAEPIGAKGDHLLRDVIASIRNEPELDSAFQPSPVVLGLAIDFVLSAAPLEKSIGVLSKFPALLISSGSGDQKRLVPHIPVVKEEVTSLYAVDLPSSSHFGGRHLHRYTVPRSFAGKVSFVSVRLSANSSVEPFYTTVNFAQDETESLRLGVERSQDDVGWEPIQASDFSSFASLTHFAADLHAALLSMSQFQGEGSNTIYVPFKAQLFRSTKMDTAEIYLAADAVPVELLGANAWHHDHDGRVRTVSVPKANAHLWRVGWTLADVLGMAPAMGGETGYRDEILSEETDQGDTGDCRAAMLDDLLEMYVLRQQLRKLQGAYISEAVVERAEVDEVLPATVRRAIGLLRNFPAGESLSHRVRHVIAMDAESRAMAIRLTLRSGEDLRHSLHRIFPEAIDRLPSWTLQSIRLEATSLDPMTLRPEISLLASLYRAMTLSAAPNSSESSCVELTTPLRTALALSIAGVGLRGTVATLWGMTAERISGRMPEILEIPAAWDKPEMIRADPQSEYTAIRRWLYNGDWVELNRATPWHWMLALVGLLEASFPNLLELAHLGQVFSVLSKWQGLPSVDRKVEQELLAWPFDTVPVMLSTDCDLLVSRLQLCLHEIDQKIGVQVVRRQAPQYRRQNHTGEFIDASGVTWSIANSQFTGLGVKGVDRVSEGTKRLSVWYESRRNSDDVLLAVHTLDFKLGPWLRSAVAPGDGESCAPVQAVMASLPPEVGRRSDSEFGVTDAGGDHEGLPEIDNAPFRLTDARARDSLSLDSIRNLQSISQRRRREFAPSSGHQDSAASGHFRVALFQWRVDDSYSHPLAEVGVGGFPLGDTSRDELRKLLQSDSLAEISKAARRGSEHQWRKDMGVISWPEHRRRVLLKEALTACNGLGVELLVLPEVSVRPETIEWLKKEIANHHPGLAILAGTYRCFRSSDHPDHLKEKLTLLWRPDERLAVDLGLEGPARTLVFDRGKKYRAVAAHELFRPDLKRFSPLYNEGGLIEQLREWRGSDWSGLHIESLVNALVHGAPKLRYCMELICSELFLITSPANRKPLEQELARILKLFSMGPEVAKQCVIDDVEAIGDLLTVAQGRRERRSVLLVPAYTSRSNDYWHAGQASVLASGTATVFCNAVLNGAHGGSCFIGINSVTRTKEHAGVVQLMTPYHGWQRGVLQANGQGALTSGEQALVVVDIDPVHVVSGKPRPQLLPEPIALVAYLPVVEVVDSGECAKGLASALLKWSAEESKRDAVDEEEGAVVDSKELELLLRERMFLGDSGAPTSRESFIEDYAALRAAYSQGGSELARRRFLDVFASNFGDPSAICSRLDAWANDRHQQPGLSSSGPDTEPAWLDFLVADLTCNGDVPLIHTPSWRKWEP